MTQRSRTSADLVIYDNSIPFPTRAQLQASNAMYDGSPVNYDNFKVRNRVVLIRSHDGLDSEQAFQVKFDKEGRMYLLDKVASKLEVYEACAADLSNCNARGTPPRTPRLLQTYDGNFEFGRAGGTMLTQAQRRAQRRRRFTPQGGIEFPVALAVGANGIVYVASVRNRTGTAVASDSTPYRFTFKIVALAPYRPPN